jgi:hypothetical protein
MIKYLVRGEKGNFLEAKLHESKVFILPTGVEINPRDLVHFGTDLVNDNNLEEYTRDMEKIGIDYLFFSGEHEELIHSVGPCGTRSETIRNIAAYLKK